MAQQYPPASAYGAQYAQGHVHPTYGSSSVSANPPAVAQQSMQPQPSLPLPSSAQNSQRYDVNAQVAAAPPPFQFPSNLNPDFFKQLANSSLPPPPPPNFIPASLTQANFPVHAPKNPFSTSPIPPQNPYLYTVASSQSLLGNGPPILGSPSMPGHGNHSIPSPSIPQEKENNPFATSITSIHPGVPKVLSHTLDGAGMSKPARDTTDLASSNQEQALLQEQASSQLQTELRTHSRETYQYPLHNQDDTRERAKAAIMLLVSSGITYEDFLKEGINAHVIGSLFDELSLDKSETLMPAQAVQTNTKREAPQQTSSNTSAIDRSTTEVAAQPTLDAGMERKDRIARLLAARKGQASVGGKLSQSASPATTPGSQPAQPVTSSAEAPPTHTRQAISQHLSNTNESRPGTIKISMSNSQMSPQDIELSYKSLPTPIRTQLEQSGMTALIPGLFMTSADLAENQSLMKDALRDGRVTENRRRHEPEAENLTTHSAKSKTDISPKSRKRGSEALGDEFLPHTKRSALESEDYTEVEMEVSRSDVDESGGSEEGEYNPEDSDRVEDTYTQLKSSKDPTDVTLANSQPISSAQSELQYKTDNAYRQLLTKQQHGIETTPQLPMESQLISTITTPKVVQAEQDVALTTVGLKNEPPKDTNVEKTNTRASPKGPKVDAGKLAARMAALKADLVAKNARKKALQEGMPVLDAEIQNTRTELVQFQTDLARTRANIAERSIELAQAKSREQDLLQKIQHLEQQLNDGVSGQKQFSNELNRLNDQIRAEETGSYVSEAKNRPLSIEGGGHVDSMRPDSGPQFVEAEHDLVTDEHIVTGQESHSEVGDPDHDQWTYTHQDDEDFHDHETLQKDDRYSTGPVENVPHNGSEIDNSTFPQAVETSVGNSDEDQMSIDDDSEEESSDASNGSASMSDSGSEEYDPEGENDKTNPNKAEGSDYEPEDTHMSEVEEQRHNDGDDYEPSDEVDVLDTAELESLRREHDSSAAISNHPRELTNGTGNATPASERPISPVKAPNQFNRQESDQTLQSEEVDSPTFTALGDNAKSGSAHFVPYRSPLTPWKSFRFHPQFNDLIKSGYRSLTYSNQIDPKRPLCPAELAGEVCTDANCEEQHFGSMALSDDKILVQMSSADDLKDKTQRDAYLIGLKSVIGDLRGRGVKEFSEVADALSKYRREWMEAQLASSTQ